MKGVGGQLPGGVAVSRLVEAVREDLIDGGAFCPVRGVEIRRDAADLPQRAILHVGIVALLEQPEAAVGLEDIEIVEVQPGMGNGEVTAPDLVGALDGLLFQRDVLSAGLAVLVFEQQRHGGGTHGAGNMDMHGAHLPGGQGAEGGLILGKLAVVQNSHSSLLDVSHYAEYYSLFPGKRKEEVSLGFAQYTEAQDRRRT